MISPSILHSERASLGLLCPSAEKSTQSKPVCRKSERILRLDTDTNTDTDARLTRHRRRQTDTHTHTHTHTESQRAHTHTHIHTQSTHVCLPHQEPGQEEEAANSTQDRGEDHLCRLRSAQSAGASCRGTTEAYSP